MMIWPPIFFRDRWENISWSSPVDVAFFVVLVVLIAFCIYVLCYIAYDEINNYLGGKEMKRWIKERERP